MSLPTDLLDDQHLEHRRRRRRNRVSMRAAAMAVLAFRKSIFIIDKDMCLCGLLSLSLSVHLICCIEVFFSMVLLLQAPDLLSMNGTYFYFLGTMEGRGFHLFVLHVAMSVSCVFTAVLLYIGSRLRSPILLLPHFLWQLLFILVSILLSIALIRAGRAGTMLLPSSIVLSAMLIIPGLFELWWSSLTYSYYTQLKSKCRGYGNKMSTFSLLPSTEC